MQGGKSARFFIQGFLLLPSSSSSSSIAIMANVSSVQGLMKNHNDAMHIPIVSCQGWIGWKAILILRLATM